MPSPQTAEPSAPWAPPAKPVEAMSMERIDFLLARAEATLRAAGAAAAKQSQSQVRGREPGFSRIADPTTATEDGLLAAVVPSPIVPLQPAGPGAKTLTGRCGSRGGYGDEMRRIADKGRSVDEVLESKPAMKIKGGCCAHFHTPPQLVS
jgi:hypothetical protein